MVLFFTSDLNFGLSSLRHQNSFNTLLQIFKIYFNVSIAMDAAPSKRLTFNFTTNQFYVSTTNIYLLHTQPFSFCKKPSKEINLPIPNIRLSSLPKIL